jgi:integrase
MGRIFKPTVYKPLPRDAELQTTRKGERIARWTDKRGKTRTAAVAVPKRGKHAGELRIVVEAGRYFAQYRGTDGVRTVPTGCRDETAARGVLRELERRTELVRGNLLTEAEGRTADHQTTPLEGHFEAYDEYLRVHVNRKTGFTATSEHRATRLRQLRRIAADLGWTKLTELDRSKLETWLTDRDAGAMGPRTRNTYAVSWTAFGNWAVEVHRLVSNPFARLAKANEDADCRRRRRALSDGELQRLIDATMRRPLAEWGRKPVKLERTEEVAKKRSHWTYANVTPDNIAEYEAAGRSRLADKPDRIAQLEAVGRLRALTYKTLVLTGLRVSELCSLTVGQVDLTGPEPYATLKPADEKARRGAEILLRGDLADDLGRHLGERLREAQRAAGREHLPLPMQLPAAAPLLDISSDAIRVLELDLIAAGLAHRVCSKNRKGKPCWKIDKRDERGRTFDMHAFRTTFNSLLAAAGVPLMTRRILMRHAAEGVTDEHYADVKLIDLRGALNRLPPLPVSEKQPTAMRQAVGAPAPVCRAVCSTDDKPSSFEAIADKTGGKADEMQNAVSDASAKPKALWAITDGKRATGLEPATTSLEG